MKILGQEYQNEKERIQFLKDNCEKIVNQGYMKPFTPEEVSEMKERLSEVSIELNDLEIEKKDTMDLFKEKMKPFVEEKHELLTNIKNKAEYVEEECFEFLDEETRMIEVYNSEGVMISQRSATQKEMQKTIFNLKTGTN